MSMIDTSSWEEDFRREDLMEADQANQADAYKEDEGFWSSVGDIAMAPVRGIAGAAEGIYSLADTLAFDLLPDAEENFGLGGSETFAGAAIETIVQFGVGFLAPGVGGLSVASKLGKIGKIGKMVDAGNKAVKTNMAAGRKVPALLMARGMEAGKYAVAGAVTDFTVFQGHEQRLSNMIQEIPSLQNPVTEFLAADEEDPELVGRLKAALEGAGIGIMVDSVLLGVRAIRAGVKAGGADKKTATVAFEQRQKELLAEQAEETKQAVEEAVEEENAEVVAKETGEQTAPKTADEAVEPEPKKTAEELRKSLLDPANRGGTGKQVVDAIDARADELMKSEQRVQQSSRPFKTESKAEYDARVARAASESRQAAEKAIEDAEYLDEAAGTRLTLLEQQIRDMGDMSEEARQALIKHRAQLGAMRELAEEVGERTNDLAKLANSGEATDRDVAEFLLMQSNYKTLANNLRAAQSEIGRNLQSIQRKTGNTVAGEVTRGIPEEDAISRFDLENLKDPETLTYILEMAGGREAAVTEMKKFALTWQSGNRSAALGFVRGKAGLTGALTEWWMNSILSGPTTMIVNGASGVATTLLAPLERSAGLALTGQFEEAGVEFGRLLNIPNEIRDALRYAKTAMKSGEGVLENVGSRADERAASGGQIEKLIDERFGGQRAQTHTGEIEFLSDKDSVAVAASKWIARNLVNAPGKLLLGTDEFFKQLNYRTSMRAELYKQAMRDPRISPRIYDAHVEKLYNRLVADGQKLSKQRFINEARARFDKDDPNYARKFNRYVTQQMRKYSPLAERALAQARETTFTTPLSRDRGPLSGIGKTVSDTVITYPALRLVLPFVRTPTNIVQFVMDRVPVVGQIPKGRSSTQGYLGKEFAGLRSELNSPNPDTRADAVGRLATGSLFFSGAAMAAMNGGITGGGPADPNQRRIKKQTGWQEYSIKVGDSYVSYRRLDPFASFFGIAADLVDIMTHGDEEQRTEAGDIALGVMMSISKNITSKTYLQGIQDLSGILFEPEQTVQRTLNRTISSFLVPNIAAQVARAGAGDMTDLRTLTENLKARVPGMSADVPPRRNMFGDPIQDNGVNVPVDLVNPFSYSTVKDDKIMAELDQIGHGFTAPRSLKGGVELRDYYNSRNQSAYDRWQEITSQTKIQGRTIKQEITKLMKSAKYKRLPYKSLDGIDRSPRARLIQSILNKYRAKAFSEMLREFPEVRERNEITKMIKGRRTAGRDYQALLALIED
ncbi:MAG: hypothetical protein Unbinned1446contig1001_22 [Prokaryotic dsDNA virus sp.]|nr:MAG: hypothetical protein Unbinned1446contig1001_22 [Prokaryotic dsDNA virus sp.]|tara:strand:- start:1076 stop:4804 length:3729 start_codon:yes stop_codon:yes gene_type:complete